MKKVALILLYCMALPIFSKNYISVKNDKIEICFYENISIIAESIIPNINMVNETEIAEEYSEIELPIMDYGVIGYYPAEKEINYILSSFETCLTIDEISFVPIGSSFEEIVSYLGKDYCKIDGKKSIEYEIGEKNFLIQVYVKFSFKNNICVSYEIYDTSMFI